MNKINNERARAILGEMTQKYFQESMFGNPIKGVKDVSYNGLGQMIVTLDNNQTLVFSVKLSD